jgi:hypothetical protein
MSRCGASSLIDAEIDHYDERLTGAQGATDGKLDWRMVPTLG